LEDTTVSDLGIDTTRPHVARMYDYYLGGKDNFAVDREAVAAVEQAMPEVRQLARENRAFLRRAVRFMVSQGIRQFVDIGAGLPTAGNTHEVAQTAAPDARVAYVDNDPIVLAHGRALLATDDLTTVVTADLREPETVFAHDDVRQLIDFNRPVGVLLIAMTHFLRDDEREPVMGVLRDHLAPGSFLAATHVTVDNHPREASEGVEAAYRRTPTPIFFRTHDEIAPFFSGFDLVEPGLVTIDGWRPDAQDPTPAPTGWLLGGVGRKP
jgi:O-methyltransferase involved in polyketide biosynthesis